MADSCTGFHDLKYSEGIKGVTALSSKRKGTQKEMRKRWTGLYQSELQICDTGNTRVSSSVWGRPTPPWPPPALDRHLSNSVLLHGSTESVEFTEGPGY